MNAALPYVLIINADEKFQGTCRPVLKSLGYQVAQAHSAHDGLALAVKTDPQIIFLDRKLPDMSGNVLMGKIASDRNVIIATGYDESASELAEAMRMGIFDSVFCPITPEKIRAAVNRSRGFAKDLHRKRSVDKYRNCYEKNFITFVCHELRSPLTAVQQYMEVLKELDLSEDQDKFIDILIRSEKRLGNMHGLIDSWLNLSRIEAGNFIMDYSQINLKDLFSDVISDLEPEIRAHSLTCTCIADDACPPLTADRESVYRVVVNLVGNALKYTPSGGNIELRCGYDDNYINISVTDTGQGIEADKLSLIFEPFFRAGRNGSFPKGYGLGLTFCKKIMDAHNGLITVISEPGKGSVFTLKFPVG